MQNSRPTSELLDLNLNFRKVLGWFISTLKLGKHNAKRKGGCLTVIVPMTPHLMGGGVAEQEPRLSPLKNSTRTGSLLS